MDQQKIGGFLKELRKEKNLTQEQFYEKLEQDAEIFTSQPTPKAVMDMWDNVLKDYDSLVYLPMSSGLSSSYQTARMLAEDYEGRVEVVNNQRISVTLSDSVKDALTMIEKGMTAAEIKDALEKEKFNQTIYITLDTLKYLKKGGRITPAAAALGTILRIKPVLQIQGDKLDEFAKARTISAAKTSMLTAIRNDIDGRLSEGGKYKIALHAVSSNNMIAAEELEKELHELFPDVYSIDMARLSLSISCHIGPGCLAVAATRIYE